MGGRDVLAEDRDIWLNVAVGETGSDGGFGRSRNARRDEITGNAFATRNGGLWLARAVALGLAAVGCLPSFAGEPPLSSTVDGVSWEYSVRNGQASVWGGRPATGALAIPSTLGGYPVTSIGERAFWGFNGRLLTTVTIPPGVTSIGEEAFEDCKGLTSVTIPSVRLGRALPSRAATPRRHGGQPTIRGRVRDELRALPPNPAIQRFGHSDNFPVI